MAEHTSPTEYIQHHLTFLTTPVRDGGPFWSVNWDTIAVSVVLGVVMLAFMWAITRKATTGVPSRTQAFVELSVDFVNNQARSLFQHDLKTVAPIALTVFVWVLLMNAMDFLPVDWTAGFFETVLRVHNWRYVPTADVNTTFALALSVFAMMIFFSIKIKGLGGWLHELFATPFGIRPLWASPLLIFFNLLFNAIEYLSKPLSHSLRLYGNMYAGEIIFLLLALFASAAADMAFHWAAVTFVVSAALNLAWAIFHILIVVLQAYIFMMLTVVYIAMAHEHH
jgi:F-type H+-transporting ATPase subunit a